ncbi:biotin/lipoyl-containing protein, partial [Bacillus sp. SS-TM]
MLVEIETDKVVLEVPASADGILDAVLEDEGTTVTSRQILGRLLALRRSGRFLFRFGAGFFTGAVAFTQAT